MTRREEIEQQAMNSYPDCPERGFGTGDYEYPEFHDDEREAFIEGAKWADKTMIEKACEWIKEHIDIPYEGRMIDGEPEAADYIEWAKERLKCAEEVAEAFRKAMEE